MKETLRLGAICCFLFSSPVFAGVGGSATAPACANVDYRGELGPVRDQNDTNWCFAYTAADMVTQKIKSARNPVSAIGTAESYYSDQTESMRREARSLRGSGAENDAKADELMREALAHYLKPLVDQDGGRADFAIEALSERGLCFESDVPSDGGTVSETGERAQAGAMRLVCGPPRVGARGKNSCTINTEAARSRANIQEALRVSWENETAGRCRRYIPGQPFQVRTVKTEGLKWTAGKIDRSQAESDKILAGVDQALSEGRIAGISYSQDFLTKSPLPARVESTHASSIVARKCDGGCTNCKYLLRNSYGKNACATYLPEYRRRCEGTHMVWLNAGEIRDYVYRVSWIK